MEQSISRLGKNKSQRSNSTCSDNYEISPAEQISNKITINKTQVFINSTRLICHTGKSGISKSTEYRDDACNYPGQ